MIYTGYYSKVKDYKKVGYTVVSISRTEPFKVDGKISLLCPDEKILWEYKHGEIDEVEYTCQYKEQLERIGIKNILLAIHKFGDDVVLLCWEAPGKFCHRHILSEYINRNSKLNIREYEDFTI